MPWEKTFDIDDAVDKALNVFWSKGYAATSLADLLSATGIAKGSFYNAFGSKKELFTKSLLKYDFYNRKAMLDQLAALENPVKAINTLFDGLIKQSIEDKEKKGCMIINIAVDLQHHDSDTVKTVKNGMKEFEGFFIDQIKLGQKNGSIGPQVRTKEAAKGLMTLVVGLRVLARGVYTKPDLLAIKSQALVLIQ